MTLEKFLEIAAKVTNRLLTRKFIVAYFFIFLALWGVIVVRSAMQMSLALPDKDKLAHYSPNLVTRFYSYQGDIINNEFIENRIYIPISDIPDIVKNAFISAEDKTFYSNVGIDVRAIFNAMFIDAFYLITGKGQLVGASTITQQVVKNVILTRERSLSRKVKEILLSIRVAQTIPKDKVLEIYLNHIFLGNNSYGVAAAAISYFGKTLKDITPAEAAVLAALPKAPSLLDPHKSTDKIINRRNWVLARMLDTKSIDEEQHKTAIASPITVMPRKSNQTYIRANGFSGVIASDIEKIVGRDAFVNGGFFVQTTLKTPIQQALYSSLKAGIEAYDKRNGYRGRISRIRLGDDACNNLNAIPQINGGDSDLTLAAVTSVGPDINILVSGSCESATIPMYTALWISPIRTADGVRNAVFAGDVIAVRRISTDASGAVRYSFEQVPQVNGSAIAMDPRNGRIVGLVGGYFENKGDFNRATQAMRQTGSVTKPFIYLTALENGFSPASTIVDAQINLSGSEEGETWSPKNHNDKFYGTTTLRYALERSLNVPTVRLAEMIGIKKLMETYSRFGIYQGNDIPRDFSLVLGAVETNLVSVASAFATIANGGYLVSPEYIEYVTDRNGQIIMNRKDVCYCRSTSEDKNQCYETCGTDKRIFKKIVSDQVNYQIISMLEGVIKRGTGFRASALDLPLCGKTGTTNDSKDSWFVGFTPELVVGVNIGFDQPKSLGQHEYGATIALPIFYAAMKQIYAGVDRSQIQPFPKPSSGIRIMTVDYRSGKPISSPDQGRMIAEVFKNGDLIQKNQIDESETFGIGGTLGESDSDQQYNDSQVINADTQSLPPLSKQQNIKQLPKDDSTTSVDFDSFSYENGGMEPD